MAPARARPGIASHQKPQRQDSAPAISPLPTRPIPAPISSPVRITPQMRARSPAGNRSPISEASVGPAVALTAPRARRDSSSHVSDGAAPVAIVAIDHRTTLIHSSRTRR